MITDSPACRLADAQSRLDHVKFIAIPSALMWPPNNKVLQVKRQSGRAAGPSLLLPSLVDGPGQRDLQGPKNMPSDQSRYQDGKLRESIRQSRLEESSSLLAPEIRSKAVQSGCATDRQQVHQSVKPGRGYLKRFRILHGAKIQGIDLPRGTEDQQ